MVDHDNNSVRDRIEIYSNNQYLFQKNKSLPIGIIVKWNLDSPLTTIVTHETFPRSVQVESTSSKNLTWTLLENVSCMTVEN